MARRGWRLLSHHVGYNILRKDEEQNWLKDRQTIMASPRVEMDWPKDGSEETRRTNVLKALFLKETNLGDILFATRK